MGLQDVIAITVALVAVVFTARFLWRSMTGAEGCSSCPTAAADKRKAKSPTLKKTPLVTLETTTLRKTRE